jgi:hypothetical protein
MYRPYYADHQFGEPNLLVTEIGARSLAASDFPFDGIAQRWPCHQNPINLNRSFYQYWIRVTFRLFHNKMKL